MSSPNKERRLTSSPSSSSSSSSSSSPSLLLPRGMEMISSNELVYKITTTSNNLDLLYNGYLAWCGPQRPPKIFRTRCRLLNESPSTLMYDCPFEVGRNVGWDGEMVPDDYRYGEFLRFIHECVRVCGCERLSGGHYDLCRLVLHVLLGSDLPAYLMIPEEEEEEEDEEEEDEEEEEEDNEKEGEEKEEAEEEQEGEEEAPSFSSSPSFPLDPEEFLISGFDITNSHFIFFVKRCKYREDYEDDPPPEWKKKRTMKPLQEEELCRFRYRLLRPQIYAHMNIVFDSDYWNSTCDDYFQKLTPHWGYVDSFSSRYPGESEMVRAKRRLERKKEREKDQGIISNRVNYFVANRL